MQVHQRTYMVVLLNKSEHADIMESDARMMKSDGHMMQSDADMMERDAYISQCYCLSNAELDSPSSQQG